MKKVFLAVLLLSSMAVSAQEATEATSAEEQSVSNEFKADQGKFMAEIGFSPVSAGFDDVNLVGGQLRGVYVASDKIKIRLGVGFGVNKSADETGVGDDWTKETHRTSLLTINPGFTYSFAGTPKLEPYVGLEVGFGTTASKDVVENNTTKITNKNIVTGINTFSFSGLTGFNYYFAKNIFVGAEIGLGFGINVQKGSYTETVTEGRIEKEESDVESHEFAFSPTFVPTLRLGWAF
ncbi:MAG: outer membrane beta-barrel protein [Paludibacteraceae bacterium]|nr:outer membrane beta-barrel protein [Paludibacteraceae bacterium]